MLAVCPVISDFTITVTGNNPTPSTFPAGSFKIEEKHFLTDKCLKNLPTCQNIRKAISDIFWNAEPYDLVLFYFSGHGFVDGYGNGYIAPRNMLRDEPFVNGISMLELKQVFDIANKGLMLMILDCCYAGIAAKGDQSRAQYENLIESNLSGK